jgi:hypothetical protein
MIVWALIEFVRRPVDTREMYINSEVTYLHQTLAKWVAVMVAASAVEIVKSAYSSSSGAKPATPAAPIGTTPVPAAASPSASHVIIPTTKPNPWRGVPGGTSQNTQPDGTPKQVRRYGPDGYPETDVDYEDHGGQGTPHAHDIGRPKDGSAPTDTDRSHPGRPVTDADPKPQ